MSTYPIRDNFDSSWLLHEGELESQPQRLVPKGNAASYAADATEEELRPGAPFNLLDWGKSRWRTVNLPHDWRIRHAPSDEGRHKLKSGYQLAYQGFCYPVIAYSHRIFDYQGLEEDERVRLIFDDGVAGFSDYWVNGFYLGMHLIGYTPISFDITNLLRPEVEGPNILLVRSDTTEAESWWYEVGGVSRYVWPERHRAITLVEHSFIVRCSDIQEHQAVVKCSIEVQNDSTGNDPLNISLEITDPSGVRVSEPAQTTVSGECSSSFEFTVENPILWDVGNGQLYTAKVMIQQGSKVFCTKSFTFGNRHVKFELDGVLINGKSHKVKGCNIQADFFGVGLGLPDRLIEAKLELLREMGANTVRIAHHPPTPELVQHADRMGLFIVPENRLLSAAPQHVDYIKTMVRIENEEASLQGTATGTAILKRLVREVNKLDPTRDTNTGGLIHLDHPYHSITNVVGMHYQGLFNTVDQTLAYFPDKPHIQDEVGLHAPTRGVYTTLPDLGHNSEFSTITQLYPELAGVASVLSIGSGDPFAKDNIATLLTEVFTSPKTVGGCLWAGIDYHGEPVPAKWPSVISPYGPRDILGIPKDYYWLVRCLFRVEPVVHAFPHWTWPEKEGQKIPFRVYSNCQEVEIFINNEYVARGKVSNSVADFPDGIAYSPGECLVRGLNDRKVVAEHRRRTAKRATHLLTQSDRSALASNSLDVALVRIAVVDDAGNLCPHARDRIQFIVTGVQARIIGVGNGDNATTEAEQGSERTAFNGWAAVLVQSGTETGNFTLSATASGLESASVVFEVSVNVEPHTVYQALDEANSPAGEHTLIGGNCGSRI